MHSGNLCFQHDRISCLHYFDCWLHHVSLFFSVVTMVAVTRPTKKNIFTHAINLAPE